MTGSAGFIGRHVIEQLELSGVDFIEVRHRWASTEELLSFTAGRQVDRCIHLGWYTEPSDYLTNIEQNRASIETTGMLAEALLDLGTGHLVAVGTSAEYKASDSVLEETDPVAPESVYGHAKVCARDLLERRLGCGTGIAWVRPFNMTGPGEESGRLVPQVVQSLLNHQPIELTAGTQVRDFLDVADVAAALVWLAQRRLTGTYNVCSGEPVSLLDLLTRIGARVGGVGLLEFGRRPRSVNDPDFVVGSNDRLCSTGWTRLHDQGSMIDRVVRYWSQAEGATR